MKKFGDLILFMFFIRPVMDMFVDYNIFSLGVINVSGAKLWGVSFILLAFLYIITYKVDVLSSNTHKTLFLFSIVIIIPLLLFTDNIQLGLERFLRYLVWILAFFVFYNIFKNKNYRLKFANYIPKMIWLVIITFSLSFILYKFFGITLKQEEDLYGYYKVSRSLGFTGFFPTIAAFSFTTLFLFISYQLVSVFYKIDYRRYLTLTFTMTVLILTSLARAVIGAMSIVLMFIFIKNKKRMFIIIASIFLLFWSFLGEEFTDQVLQDRIFGEFEVLNEGNEGIYKLGSGRMGMWVSVYSYFIEGDLINLLLGSGFDADYKATVKYIIGSSRAAHNDFLEVILNFGIVGFIFYIAFIINLKSMLLNNKYKINRNVKLILIGSLIAILFLMFVQGIITSIYMFYFSVLSTFSYWEIISIQKPKKLKIYENTKHSL